MDFNTAVKSWKGLVPSLRFLGQITLSESETFNYLEVLAKELRGKNDFSLNATELAVLAVNCAYYTYDDEGFWKHFCQPLCIKCPSALQGKLGVAIEEYFSKIDKSFHPRRGTYRFVAPIMEQCGVSRYFLKQYVEFLKELKTDCDWRVLTELKFEKYRLCIPDDMPKFLGSFLRDVGGWNFTTNVASSLSQLERGLLSHEQLCSLSSYRPGFWVDFFRIYQGKTLHFSSTTVREFTVSYDHFSDPPFMYWDSQHNSPTFITTDAVSMLPIPKLRIGNSQSLFSREYLLVYDAGKGPRSVPPTLLEEVTNNHSALDLKKLELNVPCSLSLWFEATGRFGHEVTKKEIVHIIDEISITVPEKLMALEDHTVVRLNAPEGYLFDIYSEGAQGDKRKKTWTTSCRHNLITGVLKAKNFSLQVSIPVYRDILRFDDNTKVLLKTEVNNSQFIKIEGTPGSELNLRINDATTDQSVFSGGSFGEDGSLKINVTSLRAGLNSWRKPWGVLTQGTKSPSGGILYIDLLAFLETFAESEQYYPDLFFKALPATALIYFKNFLKAINGTAAFDAKDIARFPSNLQKASWGLAICAKSFDNAAIFSLTDNNESRIIPAKTLQAVQWYQHAKGVFSNENMETISELLNHTPDIRAVFASKWKVKLQAEIERLTVLRSLENDIGVKICEWTLNVSNSQPTFMGVIAGLPNGRELTLAWRSHYRQLAVPSVVYDQAQGCAAELGVIGDLAKILQLVIFIKTNRLHMMNQINISNITSELKPYADALKKNEELPQYLKKLNSLIEGQQ